MKGYQFLWWDKFRFGFVRYDTSSSWFYVYEWLLRIGFLEIRKWSKASMGL